MGIIELHIVDNLRLFRTLVNASMSKQYYLQLLFYLMLQLDKNLMHLHNSHQDKIEYLYLCKLLIYQDSSQIQGKLDNYQAFFSIIIFY